MKMLSPLLQKVLKFTFTILFLGISVSVYAQNSSQSPIRSSFTISNGINSGGQPYSLSLSADSVQSWIVQFDDVAAKLNQSIHTTFESDFNRILSTFGNPSKLTQAISKQYEVVLSGVAVQTSADVLPYILNLPYVKSIDRDISVSISSLNKTPRISAREDNTSTRSITANYDGPIIAIIDTGIDYRHPDLGGCFGVQCKVIGGYDFVDMDNDPLDGHGHGTHVAGIAAGTGLSNGVMQTARLLAYRTLNSYGSGTASNVIAAIEQAVIDGAQVINLSLGSSDGTPSHPLSLAVNNAVRMGVIVVASAGNSGPTIGTIGTPGNAALAITVGALRPDSSIAGFSSRGPVSGTYDLKPDIAAPGVDILSARFGGGHHRLSGTSMAAPYVAGLVAQLIANDPLAPPMSWRSRVIQSATTSENPIWDVGYGIARNNDTTSDISTHPVAFNLTGTVDMTTVGLTTHVDTIRIFNRSDVANEIHIQSRPSPFTTIQPGLISATLQPESYLDIPITFTYDYTLLPYAVELPPVYVGYVDILSADDTLNVPVGLAKASVLQLEFDSPPDLVIIHNQKGDYVVRSQTGRLLNVELAKDVYDIIAIRDGDATKWILEDIQVDGKVNIMVDEEYASNTLQFDLFDANGVRLGACGFSKEMIRFNESRLALEYQYHQSCPLQPALIPSFKISDISTAYAYEVTHIAYGEHTDFEYMRYPFAFYDGINESMTLVGGQTSLIPIRWNYEVPPQTNELSFIRFYESASGNRYQPPSWQTKKIQSPWIRNEYLHVNPSADYHINMRQYDILHQLEGSIYDPERDTEVLVGPSFYTNHPDSIWLRTAGSLIDDTIILPVQPSGYYLGRSIDLLRPGMMNLEDGMLNIPPSQPWYSGWYREIRPSMVEIDIRSREGELLFSDRSKNGLYQRGSMQDAQGFLVPIPPSGAIFEMNREGVYLGNRKQQTQSVFELDEANLALARLCLGRMSILDEDGNPIQSIREGSGGSVSIQDNNCDAEVRVEMAHWLDDTWHELGSRFDLSSEPGYSNFYLSDTLAAGYWSLKLLLYKIGDTDPMLIQEVHPALSVIGDSPLPEPPHAPITILPEPRSFVYSVTTELKWANVIGANEYRVTVSRDGDFSSTVLDTVISTTSIQILIDGYGQDWFWKVKAGNENGWGPWSLRRSFTAVIQTSETEPPLLPNEYFLDQNYPNPFNPETRIHFGIARSESVTIDIYSITGQRIRKLELGVLQAGNHTIPLYLNGLSNGVYLYRLTTPSYQSVKRMTLLK